MNTEFSPFGLHSEIVQAVADLGYTSPTPIQAAVIPVMLEGHDVIGQAQTGTGKTAAFALPILNNITPGGKKPQALIVTPTRELAGQVSNAIYRYGQQRQIRVLAVYGGVPYGRQMRRLSDGVDVVVGTPGRLLDLASRQALDLRELSIVILDEADEMLSMGFVEDIEAILQQTPETRQTALFSATMPQGIRNLAKKYLRSPQTIVVENNQDTTPKIDQRYYLVNAFDKLAALTRLFEIEPITSALIFTKTRVDSDELAGLLASRGYGAEALNGDLSQDARERTFRRFRDGKISVLVATDVAARGLDVKDISHVFNYDLPYDTESYVHRVGRTGRAGKEGIAISLVTPSELWRLRRVERDTRQRIKEGTLPSEADIRLHRENQLINQVEVWLRRGRCRREQEIVADLVEAGNDPLMVAAVALKVARAEEKQRPIAELSPVETRAPRNRDTRSPRYTRSSQKNTWQERKNGRGNRESKRSHENGMIRLSLGTGRTHGIRPGDVVGAIARHANIPGETIGKIFIQDHHTFVDIEEQYVSRVLGKTGSYRIRQYQNVTIEKA